MAPKHHGDNDGLADQLQPLVDDDAFLTELSKGTDPSDGQDDLAELLLELKGDVDKQMPPAPLVEGADAEPEVIDLGQARKRRRGGPIVHGLIGAAAATLVIAGAGGAMLHAGTFDNGDKTRNVELAGTLEEMESRAAEGDIEGARELMKDARAKLDEAEGKEEKAIAANREAEQKRSAQPKPTPHTVTETATETVAEEASQPEQQPEQVTVTETQYATETVVVTEQGQPNPQPNPNDDDEPTTTIELGQQQ